ncbi:MAG TPA: response regulator [Terriglobales bacterium]|nr:response regulator [Terriglobales bacterium]
MDILIVDDESSVREVLQLCLERSGYRVRSACSAAEAFALLEGYVPEVVICDLHLSGMNGRDFCVTISDFLPTTKIFLMTGDVSSPKSCANFTVIHKPLSTTSLIKLIGPSHSEIDGAGDLGKRVEHISGSAKKFVLVLKSGPPRFTFMDWYELGFVTTWTRRPEEAEQILERHAHDLLAIDLGSNVAQVSEICARFERFRPRLRIMLLKDPAITMPSEHCGDLVVSNRSSRAHIYRLIAPRAPLWNCAGRS